MLSGFQNLVQIGGGCLFVGTSRLIRANGNWLQFLFGAARTQSISANLILTSCLLLAEHFAHKVPESAFSGCQCSSEIVAFVSLTNQITNEENSRDIRVTYLSNLGG